MPHGDLSLKFWASKYQLRDDHGAAIDRSIEDTWGRVAHDLASVEKDPDQWRGKFYSAMEDFKFIPGGRILSGAGTDRSVTLMSCYVLGVIPDSMEGIFDALKDAALTLRQGGGIGH